MKWYPQGEAYLDNPYPHLSQCRNQNPVQSTRWGSWVLFKYKDIESILNDVEVLVPEISNTFDQKQDYIFKHSDQCPFLAKATSKWPMFLNGQKHIQTRRYLQMVISQIDIKEIVHEVLDQTIMDFHKFNQFDLVDLSESFFIGIIKRIFSIPQSVENNKLIEYCNQLSRMTDPYASRSMFLKINEWLDWGKSLFDYSGNFEPFDQLALLDNSEISLSRDHMFSLWSVLMVALFETSKNNLSLTLLEMLKDKRLEGMAKEIDQKSSSKFEQEMIRYNSPAQYILRVNSKPKEIRGSWIPANSNIYLCLASANRDEDIFTEPDQIIPERFPNKHLGFGSGKHFCIGAGTAILELSICLPIFAEFISQYTLVEERQIKYSKNIILRGLESAIIQKNA